MCVLLCDVMEAIWFHKEAARPRPLFSDWTTHLSIIDIRSGRGNTRLCASGNKGENQGEKKEEIQKAGEKTRNAVFTLTFNTLK